MKKTGLLYLLMFLSVLATACGQGLSSDARASNLFKLHCQPCHPNGKNVINPGKTLYREDLKKNGITTEEDIVRIIRVQPRGMTSFDVKTLSDEDALMIARYIFETFK